MSDEYEVVNGKRIRALAESLACRGERVILFSDQDSALVSGTIHEKMGYKVRVDYVSSNHPFFDSVYTCFVAFSDQEGGRENA